MGDFFRQTGNFYSVVACNIVFLIGVLNESNVFNVI